MPTGTDDTPLTERIWRRRAKRGLRTLFELGQRARVNVLPNHFYSQVPDLAELRQSTAWREPSTMVGIAGLAVDEQLAHVRDWCDPTTIARTEDVYVRACADNGEQGYGPIEAIVLYAFLARHRPRRIVQIGCGVATSVMLQAADAERFDVEIVCVEPYPTEFLRRAADAGQITLVAEPAQHVDLQRLVDLASGDLLFVDSTHTVKPGSEVNRIVLEVLPRLADGVLVHYHDIWFPYDYTPTVLTTDLFFWGESTLVQAFLIGNERFRVLAALSTLHYWATGELSALVPAYRPIQHTHGYATGWPASGDSAAGHFPSSMYLRVGVDA